MMSMSTAATTTTAARIRKGAKTIVRVTFPDGRTRDLGGKRAERAEAVIIAAHEAGAAVGAYGVRGDYAAATTEADKLRTQTERRVKGVRGWSTMAIIPWATAYAIRVTDEAPDAGLTAAAPTGEQVVSQAITSLLVDGGREARIRAAVDRKLSRSA